MYMTITDNNYQLVVALIALAIVQALVVVSRCLPCLLKACLTRSLNI